MLSQIIKLFVTLLLSLLLISCGDSNHNNTFKESEQSSNTVLTSNSETDNQDDNYANSENSSFGDDSGSGSFLETANGNGDNSDNDDDNDGNDDTDNTFLLVPIEDTDIDNDGTSDSDDAFP